MTVLSRSKKAAVRTGVPDGVSACGAINPPAAGSGAVTAPSIGAVRDKRRQSVQIGSSRQVSVTAIFPAIRCFLRQAVLAPIRSAVCIVRITRLMPGVHQPDPPGLIHDDLRLLPPWRGSSLFTDFPSHCGYVSPSPLVAERDFHCGHTTGFVWFIHRFAFVHRRRSGDGVVSSPGRRLRS